MINLIDLNNQEVKNDERLNMIIENIEKIYKPTKTKYAKIQLSRDLIKHGVYDDILDNLVPLSQYCTSGDSTLIVLEASIRKDEGEKIRHSTWYIDDPINNEIREELSKYEEYLEGYDFIPVNHIILKDDIWSSILVFKNKEGLEFIRRENEKMFEENGRFEDEEAIMIKEQIVRFKL